VSVVVSFKGRYDDSHDGARVIMGELMDERLGDAGGSEEAQKGVDILLKSVA
jgi:hypothetical protein